MRYRVKRCRLGEILDRRRMTNRDLAILTNIAEQNISAYVNNRKRGMSLSIAKTIAVTLDVPLDDLFEWERLDD